MLKNPPSRLRAALGLALAGALACAGGVAIPLTQAPEAQARESGAGGQSGTSISGGGSGSITERLPSGVKLTISKPQILLTGYKGTFRPQTGYTNPANGSGYSMLMSDWTTPQNAPKGLIWAQNQWWNRTLPYNGNNNVPSDSVTLPASYFNNNKFYDTSKFTVTFDPPIANPILNMAMQGWSVGTKDNVDITKPFGKLSIVGATGQNGNSIPVTMSRAAGWDYGGYNFIFRNGTSMEDPVPANGQAKYYIKGNNYSGGTTAFNSNGQAVSSITFVSANSFVRRGSRTIAFTENWGFQLNVPQSVSSLSRLVPGSSFGDVTHAVTDSGVRIGALVAEGNRSRYTNAANSGTASDNSDAGMDGLKGRSLPSAAAGQTYTVDNIPVSNTSRQTLGLQGWIDFNGNGKFDPGEGSQVASVAPGQSLASLTWTVPASVAATGKQALRLRLGPVDQITDQPAGMAAMGEVEDYPAIVPTQTAPDLQVVKSTQTASVEPGGQVVYFLDVKNNSAATVDGVTVSDQIPTQVASFTAAGTQGTQYDGSRNFVWNVGSLGAGASARITITGTVAATVAEGSTITNTAVVASPQGCLVPASCSSSVTDTVQAGKVTGLEIVKTNDLGGANPLVSPGDEFTYQIAVTNNSGKAYQNLVINERLPKGLTYVSGSGWTFNGLNGSVTIANLAAGQREVLTLRVKVDNDAAGGEVRNVSVIDQMNTIDACIATPKAEGCGVDQNPPTVIETPLKIYKTNDLTGDTITAGTEFTYTITVTNPGGRTANQVQVTDIIPKELEFATTTQTGWATISGRSAVSNTFNLAPGADKTLELKVRAITATTQMITNMVMAEQLAPSTADNAPLMKAMKAPAVTEKQAEAKIDACVEGETSGTCVADDSPFEVLPAPEPVQVIDPWQDATPVKMTTTVTNNVGGWVNPGTTFFTMITITNPGKSDQTGITVKAAAPAGVTFTTLNATGGWTLNGTTATSAPITIKAGSATSLYLPGKVATNVTRGQQFTVPVTIDGTNPANCNTNNTNCYYDPTAPRSLR